jgi:hypothetical protein
LYLGGFPNRANALLVTAIAATHHPHTMPRAKSYSPQLRRDLVTRLNFRAQAEWIPMTRLADRLINEALARPTIVHQEFTVRVAEEPQPAPVPG